MMSVRDNDPALWLDFFPRPSNEAHKYTRGHLAVFGAPALTGATRLAASAASRMGAGLVSVLSDADVANVYRASLPADLMVTTGGLDDLNRVTAILAGPGGLVPAHREMLQNANPLPIVLDADAIGLWSELGSDRVLTPHEGEFAKAFPDIIGDRMIRTRKAAERTGAIVVLKGSETLIAAPDGRLICNRRASPYLAKAGTGDVLAGMIAGLLAQNMPAFEAAAAAVWLHGDASLAIGPGLIAGDLIDHLPTKLRTLLD